MKRQEELEALRALISDLVALRRNHELIAGNERYNRPLKDLSQAAVNAAAELEDWALSKATSGAH